MIRLFAPPFLLLTLLALCFPVGAQDDTPAGESVDVAAATTENPAASPEPPPAPQLKKLDFSAPFSLKECLGLLDQAVSALPKSPDKQLQYTTESVWRLIDSVERYIKHRDEMHSSTMDYEWEEVRQRVQVKSSLIETSEIQFLPGDIPRDVNAVALAVKDGDALVHFVKIENPQNEEIPLGFPNEPVLLRNHLPRRAVFHLLKPTDIKVITIGTSMKFPGEKPNPYLNVFLGRSDKPEYGKMAIWHIQEAERALNESDYVQASADLAAARRFIVLYREVLRAERR